MASRPVSTAMNGSGRVIGGPHPAFGHPLPEGEGLDLGRVAPAFGHPLPEGEGLDLGRVAPPSATRETGCVKTPVPRYERPIRHSRESGNPGAVEGCYSAVSPLHPAWIPAFAGVSKLPPLPLGEGWGEGTSWQAGRCQRQRMGAAGLLGALTRPSATLSQRERGWIWDGSHRPSATLSQRERGWIWDGSPRLRPPAKQAVSKRQFPGTKGQSVIPAKAGIQGRWRRATAPFPRSTPPGFPLSRVCQNCPLSLWERVGVREPRGEQAGVNGNEWERQGYWGPSPGLRPPSPRGRGVGFGTDRTGLRPPSPRGRGVGFGTGRTAKRTRRFVTVFVRHHTRVCVGKRRGLSGAFHAGVRGCAG